LNEILDSYDENKFNEILDIFYTDKRLSNTFPSGSGKYDFIDYPDLYGWIIFENDILHPTYIKKTNDYILYLKDEYEEYEENVEHSGLQDKKVFTYGEIEEKTEEVKPVAHVEPVAPVAPVFQKVPLAPTEQLPSREDKTKLPIIKEDKDEEHKENITRKRKAEGGKRKKNKSIRKNNIRKRKTNKRRQSKRNGK
jgi:hypothetical protein